MFAASTLIIYGPKISLPWSAVIQSRPEGTECVCLPLSEVSLSFKLNFKFKNCVITESLVGFMISFRIIYLVWKLIYILCSFCGGAQLSFIMSRSLLHPLSPFLSYPRRCSLRVEVSLIGSQLCARHCCMYFAWISSYNRNNGLWSGHNILVFQVPNLWLKDVKSHAHEGQAQDNLTLFDPIDSWPVWSLLSWNIRGTFMGEPCNWQGTVQRET